MKMVPVILVFILVYSNRLNGQELLLEDTLRIGEVIVKPKGAEGESGYKLTYIDSDIINVFGGESLSELLSRSTNLCIKDYGQGGLSTASFRGMGASHTKVIWEGLNINSPMISQSDFSLIPVYLASNISVYHGAVGSDIINGGPGGSISLKSRADWKDGLQLTFSQEFGTYGYYSGIVKVSAGNSNFQSVTKAFYKKSRNNFLYKDNTSSNIGQMIRREDAGYYTKGIMQEFYIRQNGHLFTTKIWYNKSERHLPGPIIIDQPAGNESQTDESLKAVLTYSNHKHQGLRFEFKGGFSTDWLKYTNKMAGINSRNKMNRLFFIAGYEKDFNEKAELQIRLSEEYDIVNSVNYLEKAERSSLALGISFTYQFYEQLGILLSVKEELVDNKFNPPSPSAGLEFRIFPGKEYYINGNIGRSFNLPSLNDLYWNPGGNSQLYPEEGINYELTFSGSEEPYPNFRIEVELTAFSSRIKNMIKWLPGDYSYWEPGNLGDVRSKGIESMIRSGIVSGRHQVDLSIAYSFTSVYNTAEGSKNDVSAGKQLVYVPENQSNMNIQYEYGKFYFIWHMMHTGLRYTSSDNTEYLPGYLVNDLIAGVKISLGDYGFGLAGNIDNIFNIDYQNIAWYPMPGRYFGIKLKYTGKNE